MNASGSRSLTGNRLTWSAVTVVEISVLVVWTVSTPAVTSIDVVVAASTSLIGTRSVVRAGSTFTFSSLKGTNPAASTIRSYDSGRTLSTTNKPSAVVAVASSGRWPPCSSRLTVALGTAAPDGSTTDPVIRPLL